MLPANMGPTKLVALPGRGIIQVRDIPGPANAATIILLHGLAVTADLNWCKHYELLATRYRVVSYDHHGHGSGLRLRKKFSIADVADDVVRVADALKIDKFTPVGYSLGGAVAQTVARRHPERVQGMVLAATSNKFVNSRYSSRLFLVLKNLARLSTYAPKTLSRVLVEKFYGDKLPANLDPWVIPQLLGHDWTTVAWAGVEAGRYDSSAFLPGLSTRSSVLVTAKDTVVPLDDQERLFSLLKGDKKMFRVDGNHLSVYTTPNTFGPVLLDACIHAAG